MVTITKAGAVKNGKQYLEFAGLSTDNKPTAGVMNGSLFHEMDTTKIYAFSDKPNDAQWFPQVQLTEQEESASLSMAASPSVNRPALQLNQGVPTLDLETDLENDLDNEPAGIAEHSLEIEGDYAGETEPEETDEEPEGDGE